ncbi:MAG: hypothetical protein RJA07_421 [Bacteroidota bacterium]|jgi:uncharacterized FAD-dependent dehydrogenase
MQKIINIKVKPAEAFNQLFLREIIAQECNLKQKEITGFHILRRSIDARSRQVYYTMNVLVFINEPIQPKENIDFIYQNISTKKQAIIIGAGPAGLFAALRLIELGIKPIIIERGKNVRERRRDLAKINRDGEVNPESNYCFGEGGAGTYSDGKLYTRSSKRGDVKRILHRLVKHGATEEILVDTHPHIGTNHLPQIISDMRDRIIECGGEVHFSKKLTDLIIDENSIKGITCHDGSSIEADAVILATGHSARDIFELLDKKNILIEAKPFALGVRIEHPQHIIDAQQYHCETREESLPPAAYSLVEQVNGKGVFSFCMCPGGIIAAASTAPNEIVVNGWSPSKRNNPFANSGMVVQVDRLQIEDFLVRQAHRNSSINTNSPLSFLQFQKSVEQKCFEIGGGKLVAPAQRMVDFTNNKISNSLPQCSYQPGLKSVDLRMALPQFVTQSLQGAFKQWSKKMKNYYTNEAVLVATESRTSSPVRIPRDKETLQHPQIKGLFPCGEGAGYAGGIVSAAMDGENCADAIDVYYKQ